MQPAWIYIPLFCDGKKSGLLVKIWRVWKSHLKFVKPSEKVLIMKRNYISSEDKYCYSKFYEIYMCQWVLKL